MKSSRLASIVFAGFCLTLPACEKEHEEEHSHDTHKIIVTSPVIKDMTVSQPYVCQIHSQNHINVQALQGGYLEAIPITEGQAVKKGDVLFQIVPILLKARLQTEQAEVKLAELEFSNTKKLYDEGRVVSQQEVFIYQAKLARMQAKLMLAQAELDFATVKAPFDGVVDRMMEQQGSLVKEGDDLTTLSDNSVMWVYFNVPEKRYLEYMGGLSANGILHLKLQLADGSIFPHASSGKPRIEAQFNNKTGNIPFRADFPNPDGLLRHGQTGTVLLNRPLKDAVVIPQRATYEILDKRYVFVVDKENVVHQRQIMIEVEKEDIYIIGKYIAGSEPAAGGPAHAGADPEHRPTAGFQPGSEYRATTGLQAGDKIVLEGVRQVHDGDKIAYEFEEPEKAISSQKQHAE